MNCVNCGAAPASGSSDCCYCGTACDQVDPVVDRLDFTQALTALSQFNFDPERVTVAKKLGCKVGLSLTAGQVRALLQTFHFDPFRLEAGIALVPCCTHPVRLFECGDVFLFDPFRTRFLDAVAAAVAGSRAQRRSERGPTPVSPANPTAPLSVLVLTAAVVFLATAGATLGTWLWLSL